MESGIISRMKSTFRSAATSDRVLRAPASTSLSNVGPALLCTAASDIAEPAFPMVKDDSSIAGSKPHYCTVGVPIDDETGLIRNAALLPSGKRKDAWVLLSESLASALLDEGPRLDALQYFLMHKDRAGAPARAISLTRNWKAMLPEPPENAGEAVRRFLHPLFRACISATLES
ncbi:MAG TPA: hypothetical protein VF934_13335 [Burkholderiales bacterium]